MTDATAKLLKTLLNLDACGCEHAEPECSEMRDACGEGLKECFALQELYDAMERSDEDQEIIGKLGEVEQTIGALDRELRATRDQLQKQAQVRKQLKSVIERVVKPLI